MQLSPIAAGTVGAGPCTSLPIPIGLAALAGFAFIRPRPEGAACRSRCALRHRRQSVAADRPVDPGNRSRQHRRGTRGPGAGTGGMPAVPPQLPVHPAGPRLLVVMASGDLMANTPVEFLLDGSEARISGCKSCIAVRVKPCRRCCRRTTCCSWRSANPTNIVKRSVFLPANWPPGRAGAQPAAGDRAARPPRCREHAARLSRHHGAPGHPYRAQRFPRFGLRAGRRTDAPEAGTADPLACRKRPAAADHAGRSGRLYRRPGRAGVLSQPTTSITAAPTAGSANTASPSSMAWPIPRTWRSPPTG